MLPYSGNLSREKIFVNFTISCVMPKVLVEKYWGQDIALHVHDSGTNVFFAKS